MPCLDPSEHDRTGLGGSTEVIDRAEAWQLVARVGVVMDRVRSRWRRLLGLNVSESLAVSVLWELGEMPMSELADHIGISRAAMTTLSDRLVVAGYVERVADTKDRRRTIISLAPGWAAEIGDEVLAFEQDMHRFASSLTPDEWQGMRRGLDGAYAVSTAYITGMSTDGSSSTKL